MYIKSNVRKPLGISPGSAAAKEPNVTIVDVEDVLYHPPRDSKGINMVGSYVMKPNARMVQIYMTKSKISTPYESDGDEDSINIKQSFEGQHPGNKLEIREFIQNWLGKNVIVIHGSCSEPEREVVGTPCAPLQLKPSKQDNNDGRFHMLKFEAYATSQFLPGRYMGALVFDEPTPVDSVVAIPINTHLARQIKLPALDSTEAISMLWSSAAVGEIVTLVGSGGDDPATLTSGSGGVGAITVILKNGVDWIALNGSFIHLRPYSGDASYFIEESRG